MLGDIVSSLLNILFNCIQVVISRLLNSFAHFCGFSRLRSIIEQVKLGVSGNEQTSATSRKTIKIFLFSLTSLVLDLAPWLQLREKVR